MHHNGCKIWPYQWTLAVPGHPTADEEGGVPLEEEGDSTDSTTINPPTASKTMPRLRETHQTHVFNVDK